MKGRLLVRGARQLLTLRGSAESRNSSGSPDLGIVTDGSVLIENGEIVHVGPSRRIDNLAAAKDAIVLEAHGAVVLPAFIDARTFLPENGVSARRAIHLAGEHGTAAMSVASGLATLRSLLAVNPLPMRLVPTLEPEDDDEMQPARVARLGPNAFMGIDLFRAGQHSIKAIRSAGGHIRSRYTGADGADWFGLALAIGSSLVDVRELTTGQAALLAESQIPAVIVPQSAGSARSLLDAGCQVALGSGFGLPAGFTCSMLTAMGTVCREGGIQPAEAIPMATRNAARALGIAGRHGSIESGKQADLLVLHLPDYREFPQYYGVNIVSRTIRAGRLIA